MMVLMSESNYNDLVRRQRMTTLETQLELSIIYRTLLTDITCLLNISPSPAEASQCVTLINEAFSRAVNHLSARCPQCDSDDVTIVCDSCSKENGK